VIGYALYAAVIALLLGRAVRALQTCSSDALPAIRQVVARPTTPIADVSPGPAEIAGRITAGQPLRSPLGASCIALDIDVYSSWTTRRGKTSTNHRTVRRRQLVARDARVSDGTGECGVSPTEVEIVGRTRSIELPRSTFLARFPALADMVNASATQVELVERLVRDGDSVLVSGFAEESQAIAPDDYRGRIRHEYVLLPKGKRVLVSLGGQWRFLARATAPLVATALTAAWLIGVALLMAAVAIALS
jgi:hypothetical protein